MLLKVIKEIKYDYDKIVGVGEIVELVKECDYCYVIKTSSNIKINIMKDKVDNLIGFDITNKGV